MRRSIALAGDASRAAEAAGDRRKALEVAESIGEGYAASQRRLEAAQATGDADLIAEAQDDVADAQAAYQEALAAAERAWFVAGTLILTPTGLRAIESLKVGETVLAGDPTTGAVKECGILQTFVHEASQVFELHIGNLTITCTAEHPFWVVDRGWTAAGKLQVGNVLTTSDGKAVTVQSVRSSCEQVNVYNFEVEELHTYFVSNLGILVHNTCAATPSDILMPGGIPLGSAGTSDDIREVQGGVDDALRLFDSLTQGGTVNTSSGYPGLRIDLPNGGTVSIRTEASRSPNTSATVDINIPGVPIRKIKFNP